jgi:GntR family transcriptional regulator, transcriptional repressor for pyruvate dehydrogenase complex
MTRRVKTGERVAQLIIQEIVDHRLDSGDFLPSESEFVEKYQVGRAAVREALRILEVQGLITVRTGQNGGPRVASPSAEDFGRMATLHLQMADASFASLAKSRLLLEPLMAAQAAVRQDREAIAKIWQTLDEEKQVPAFGDHGSAATLAFSFHGAVDDASGNSVLALCSKGLGHIWYERTRAHQRHFVEAPEDQELMLQEHTKITKAIDRGDDSLAQRLMRDHERRIQDEILRHDPELSKEVISWM